MVAKNECAKISQYLSFYTASGKLEALKDAMSTWVENDTIAGH